MIPFTKKALFMIGIASELANVHPQTLRIYEKKGLLKPKRTAKNTRLYSQEDIRRLERINQLTDRGVNLAGIIKILEMEDEIQKLVEQLSLASREIEELTRKHKQNLEKVHKSYRRELVVMPRGEIQMILTRSRRGRDGL